MKKMMYAAVFSVSLLLPCFLNAQEAEPDPGEENAEPSEAAPQDKTGKQGKAAKTGGTPESAKAPEGNALAKDSDIARQQKKIEKLLTMLKKAKKNSERKRIDEALKAEQHKLQVLLKKKTDPLKADIPRLQEQIRLCRAENREKLEKKLSELESKIKELEADANLEKWCSKYESGPKAGPSPNPGPGKRTKRSKKKKQ